MLRMHGMRGRQQRLVRVEQERQILVLDEHVLARVFRQRAGFRNDSRHPLADIAGAVDGQRIAPHQRRMRPRRQRVDRRRQCVARDHGPHPGHRQRHGCVDRDNPRRRPVRLHGDGVQHPRQRQVGRIIPRTRDETAVLPHPAFLADIAERAAQLNRHSAPSGSSAAEFDCRSRSAASAIASMIWP